MNCKNAIKDLIKKKRSTLDAKIWSIKISLADKLLNGTGMYLTNVSDLIQFGKSVVSYIAPNSGLAVEEKSGLNKFFIDLLASYRVSESQKADLEGYLRLKIAMSDKTISDKFKQQIEEYFEDVIITHTVKQRYKLGN